VGLLNVVIRAQCYKTFSVRNVQIVLYARVFVAGRPFQPDLMVVGKANSLPLSGPHKCCFTWPSSSLLANIRLG